MPIFEYRCKKCNNKFEVLHKSSSNLQEVICPSCNSTENQKLFSSFASTGSSTSGSYGCETGNCGVDSNYSGGCASGMCGLN
jgi:putative FmdB family regulatory protein